ncbi:hypothetical protein AKJ65_04480, partial [candidate division MSBL1 archaeon SCGC-AAA259E19]
DLQVDDEVTQVDLQVDDEVTHQVTHPVSPTPQVVRSRTGADVDVEMLSAQTAVVRADPNDVPRIIGRNGRTIEDIQDTLGVRIDVREREGGSSGGVIEPKVTEGDNHVLLEFGSEHAGKEVRISAGGSLIFKGSIGKDGSIKIKKDTQIGRQMEKIRSHDISIEAEIV